MPQLPSWLNPPDIAGQYAHGLSLGVSLAQEQARLAEEENRLGMEMQARQQQAERDQQMQKAQMETQAAYRAATLGIQKQKLQDAQQKNSAETQAAAMEFAQAQRRQELKATGKYSDEDILWMTGGMTPPRIAEFAKSKSSAEQQDKNRGVAQQRIDLEKSKESRLAETGQAKDTGLIDYTPTGIPESSGVSGVKFRGVPVGSAAGQGIIKRMGTNAPAGFAMPVPGAPVVTGNSPYAEGTRIRSKTNPDKVYVVRNGVPVEESLFQVTPTPDTGTTEEQ